MPPQAPPRRFSSSEAPSESRSSAASASRSTAAGSRIGCLTRSRGRRGGAQDTLGAAVAVAAELPAQVGDALLAVARESFVDGIQVVAAVGVVVAIAVAAFTFMTLRQIPPTEETEAGAAAPAPTRGEVPQTTFYCG